MGRESAGRHLTRFVLYLSFFLSLGLLTKELQGISSKGFGTQSGPCLIKGKQPGLGKPLVHLLSIKCCPARLKGKARRHAPSKVRSSEGWVLGLPRNCPPSFSTKKTGHQGPARWDIPDPRSGMSRTKTLCKGVCCF